MSMETLETDVKANIAELGKLSALSSTDELVRHLKDVLWPTIEAMVEELREVDTCVADMVNNAEDILQPETGAVLSAVVAGAVTVSQALKARITREAEPELYRVITELEKNCKEASGILEEIVLDELEDDDLEDDGGDADDDDDEDDDDDDDHAQGATP